MHLGKEVDESMNACHYIGSNVLRKINIQVVICVIVRDV